MKYISTKIIEAKRFEWGMEDGIRTFNLWIPKDAEKYPESMHSKIYPGYLKRHESELDTRCFDMAKGYTPYIGDLIKVSEYSYIKFNDDGSKDVLSSFEFEKTYSKLENATIDNMQIVLALLEKFNKLYPEHMNHHVDIYSDGSCGIKYVKQNTPERKCNYLDWDHKDLQELYAFAKRMISLSDEEIFQELQYQVNERLGLNKKPVELIDINVKVHEEVFFSVKENQVPQFIFPKQKNLFYYAIFSIVNNEKSKPIPLVSSIELEENIFMIELPIGGYSIVVSDHLGTFRKIAYNED